MCAGMICWIEKYKAIPRVLNSNVLVKKFPFEGAAPASDVVDED
ncbi:MAG TPA: hypothetical protein VGQ56_08795 [Gemmatimonadaceae bacterium]|jgi:hypothetical protein|nr:hypothetical protein [Gemmatimonadaceae bacterium]